MSLRNSYEEIAKCVVAIAEKRSANAPMHFVPEIIGTGFVVADGVVATNDHVIRTARLVQNKLKLPANEWPFEAVLFYELPGRGMAQLTIGVLGAFVVETFEPAGVYYGPDKPDIGLIHVDMRGLPKVKLSIEQSAVAPGVRLATVGFPMGTRTLTAPGYVHQLCPTLQEAVVSAVLPFPSAFPHALMLNMMSQGGASGSPIFLPETGEVVAILYAGLNESYSISIQGVPVPYRVPTNFTYCVPAHFLYRFLESTDVNLTFKHRDDCPNFEAIISDYVVRSAEKRPE